MIKKVRRIGNSRGIILEKAILEAVDYTDETELDIKINGRRITIEPVVKPATRPNLFAGATGGKNV